MVIYLVYFLQYANTKMSKKAPIIIVTRFLH